MKLETKEARKLIANFNIRYEDKGGYKAFERTAFDEGLGKACRAFGFGQQYGTYIFKTTYNQSYTDVKYELQTPKSDRA